MLHINQTIELVFRKKEVLFSKDFWKGLILAGAIHLLLFLGIKIALPPNLEAIKPLNPVAVEIDLGSKTAAINPTTQMMISPFENLFPSLTDTLPEKKGYETTFLLQERVLQPPMLNEFEPLEYTVIEELFEDM